MSCPIGNGGAHGELFLRMAESLSNYTDKAREMCSAKVNAKITGVILAVIGLLVAAAGIVVAAVGIGCATSLAAGLGLVIVGSVLLGLGLAKMRSRRSELERQLATIEHQIQNLREEHEALEEVYNINRLARRAAGERCQELENQILELCEKHAQAIRTLEEDARKDKELVTDCFKKRLQQSQDTCSQLTAELCKAKNQCEQLQQKLCSLESKKKK
ncbi:phage holin family protein [Chlamydia suis]|uniref:phage holin family protein n=1 Tax=Chlamydia suis TaxID=83559 RepID=UPI000BEF1526|nr:phage holin family protein [Chlamydia suis]